MNIPEGTKFNFKLKIARRRVPCTYITTWQITSYTLLLYHELLMTPPPLNRPPLPPSCPYHNPPSSSLHTCRRPLPTSHCRQRHKKSPPSASHGFHGKRSGTPQRGDSASHDQQARDRSCTGSLPILHRLDTSAPPRVSVPLSFLIPLLPRNPMGKLRNVGERAVALVYLLTPFVKPAPAPTLPLTRLPPLIPNP